MMKNNSINSKKKLQILKFPKIVMVVFGIWRNQITSNAIIAKLYQFYSVFIHIFILLLTTSMCIWVGISLSHKTKAQEEIEKMITAFSYLMNMFVILLKVTLVQTRGVRNAFAFVEDEEEKMNKSKDRDILDAHLEQVNFCNSVNTILALFYLLLYVCFALIENTLARINVKQYNDMYNETLIKPLIYEVYLYKVDPIKYETIIMLYEYIGAFILLAFSLSTNAILSCIMFALSMIKALQIKLRKMAHKDQEAVSILKKNAKEHQQFIRFLENLNELLKYLILIEYSTISLNIALVALRFLQDDTPTMRIGRVFFSGAFVVYILALGWSSNEIKLQSMAISDAMYDTSWYDQSEEAKRILLIMMMRTRKPLRMTKGPFDEMTLESAVTELMKVGSLQGTPIRDNWSLNNLRQIHEIKT
ncbi:odorant receptor Or2-like isoform X2 [Cylas formicarius]|uniref:odorant receptor Or2-like isoform X2 n=1 Tax=Cylas formicarius TaxID=197179 RepID=UPI002958956D|nr:odorant receptor Or2-like isoform X2 [Cylas formicarius]